MTPHPSQLPGRSFHRIIECVWPSEGETRAVLGNMAVPALLDAQLMEKFCPQNGQWQNPQFYKTGYEISGNHECRRSVLRRASKVYDRGYISRPNRQHKARS